MTSELKNASFYLLIVLAIGLVTADVEQAGSIQVQSSYNEAFVFPMSLNGVILNTTDTTNHWLLQLRQIFIGLSINDDGSLGNFCTVLGNLVELSTANNYEFTSTVNGIPFTWLRSVPDGKWVNIQNVVVPVTSGSLQFNFTINYADFWTNVQAGLTNDKIISSLQSNCTTETFHMTENAGLASKPFWIVLKVNNGQQLTFPVPSGYSCIYSRGMRMVRTAC